MSKDDLIDLHGVVVAVHSGGLYRVKCDAGHEMLAQLSGRMRRFHIKVVPGDRVTVGVSPYDPLRGFITFRARWPARSFSIARTDTERTRHAIARPCLIGALVILAGAISFSAPDLRLAMERWVTTPAGLYAITSLRIAIGLVFVVGAPASRAPRTLRVLGLIVIISGVMTPWFGVARSRAVLNWLANAVPLLMRLDASAAMAIGGLLVYVFRTPTATTSTNDCK